MFMYSRDLRFVFVHVVCSRVYSTSLDIRGFVWRWFTAPCRLGCIRIVKVKVDVYNYKHVYEFQLGFESKKEMK